MFESSKFDKSGLKSGGHIRPGPDLAGFEKNGRIPAGAGAGYDIRCNPSNNSSNNNNNNNNISMRLSAGELAVKEPVGQEREQSFIGRMFSRCCGTLQRCQFRKSLTQRVGYFQAAADAAFSFNPWSGQIRQSPGVMNVTASSG